MDVNKTFYPFYPPKIMPYVYGRRKGVGKAMAPWILKFVIFLLSCIFSKQVDFLVSSEKIEISPPFDPSGKIFLTTPQKNPLASPGKNPSNAHIAATGTMTRYIGSNSQVITIIYTKGGQTFRYGESR